MPRLKYACGSPVIVAMATTWVAVVAGCGDDGGTTPGEEAPEPSLHYASLVDPR